MPANTTVTVNSTFKLKTSNTAFSVPSSNAIQLGEPALNLTDGRLYVKLNTGTVIDISSTPAGNTFYVSKNGNDKFDGRTPGASKASIRSAAASCNPGDSIFINSGTYTEITPIIIPQQVQVCGAGERNTIIQPVDPTKDIFWLNNLGYVTAVKFINYSANAICFPAPTVETGTANGVTANTITLANTSTLVDGYYNSMQVAIASGANTSFIYDTKTCFRDVGYIVDSISFDLLYGGNRQAVQSGVYYYSFNGSSSAIQGEQPQTIAAYNRLSTVIGQIILGQTVTKSPGNGLTQNTSVGFGTSSEVTYAQNDVSNIVNIITNGPTVAPPKIPMPLTPSSNTNVYNAANILQVNRAFMQAEIVAYINTTYPGFVYNQTSCSRDTGLIVDAISLDLYFDTNSQSTFAGLQYWNQNAYTGKIASQVSLTANAINYVSSLAQNVIIGSTATPKYQSLYRQVFANNATNNEANTISNNFSIVTNILLNGTANVSNIIVSNIIQSNTSANVINAYNLLQLNKSFLQAEAVAYVESNKYVNIANIVSYNASTQMATIDKNWTGLPSANCNYVLSIPLRTTPAPTTDRYSTYITGSPYIYNSASVNTLPGIGLVVDGARATGNKSMISSQFTQTNQGGYGFKVLNDGYSQLVSIYAIWNDIGFNAESGGTASMGNCNVNFGNKGLYANGYGSVIMSGLLNGSQSLTGSNVSINNIITNSSTAVSVSANVPYSGLLMFIANDTSGNYYNVSGSTLLDANGNTVVSLQQSNTTVWAANTPVYFYQQSQLRASGQTFEFAGAGTTINALPRLGGVANAQQEIQYTNGGVVFATSTDENGNFQVGDLVLNQATSTISGRTFNKSLFAVMTPYILALEG